MEVSTHGKPYNLGPLGWMVVVCFFMDLCTYAGFEITYILVLMDEKAQMKWHSIKSSALERCRKGKVRSCVKQLMAWKSDQMEGLKWEGEKRKFSQRKKNWTELIVNRHGGTQDSNWTLHSCDSRHTFSLKKQLHKSGNSKVNVSQQSFLGILLKKILR